MTGPVHETSSTHAQKVERKRANFLLGFEAWTGVTSLSVGVFGKCGYLIYSASKISYSAATDANLSKNNNQIINGEDVKVFCYEEISLDRLKQKKKKKRIIRYNFLYERVAYLPSLNNRLWFDCSPIDTSQCTLAAVIVEL